MGKVRTKVIETAIEPEKLKQIEELEKTLPFSGEESETAPTKEKKTEKKVSRPPKQRSKRYRELVSLIDKSTAYSAQEAIEIVKKTATTRFDATIETHINLGLSTTKQEHKIRTMVTLPYPTSPVSGRASRGKQIKILVFASKDVAKIKKLGFQIGTDSTLKEIEEGKINFNKIIADSAWMPKLANLAKVLGPKGLMPNPKNNTLTEDPLVTLEEFSKGKTELRMETSPIIHISIGKTSLEDKKLLENLTAIITAVRAAKPEGFKKELIKSIFLSATMGPSVKVDPQTVPLPQSSEKES